MCIRDRDNVFVRQDPAGNIKMDKEKSTEKIDGAVATVMALDRAIRNEGTTAVSYTHLPNFTDSELKTESFETYSDLDSLGRCGIAYANICLLYTSEFNISRKVVSKIKSGRSYAWVEH